MIVAGSASPLLLASAAGGYNLTNSLRFRSSASAYLNRTPASAGSLTTWTWSAWVKRGTLGVLQTLFGTSSTEHNVFFTSGNVLTFQLDLGGANDFKITTTQVFRDPSAWYHIVAVWDTTNATSSNRMRFYVNGVEVTSFSITNYPTSSLNGGVNSTIAHYIGNLNTARYFDGYMTEVNFIDGQALTPSSFGENNEDTGVWQPKKYAGTYGTNGFYLPFSDNASTTTLGNDFSGNGNNWTTNNISLTAGATYDSMTDVPTLTSATASNFAVVNPLKTFTNGLPTISSANLNISASDDVTRQAIATMGFNSGKFYWETTVITLISGFDIFVGILSESGALSSSENSSGTYRGTGQIKNLAGTTQTAGNSYTTNDVVGIAVDCDAGTVQFYKNGTAQGATPSFTFTANTFVFPSFVLDNNTGTRTLAINFGQRPFAYTPPTGFVALNTFNLPTPTIGATASTQAGDYFNAVTYTGNGTNNRAVTGVGFQPDFTWIKQRSAGGQWHMLTDAVRGTNKLIYSNSTSAENTETNYLKTFTSDGFTVGTDDAVNENGGSFVAWNWRASNATAVSNTAGSITSTVSANTSAGFSIVTWTGAGSVGTIGHGLGVAPNFIIIKRRNSAVNWFVGGSNIAAVGSGTWSSAIEGLNTTATVNTGATAVFNSTAPTSTVFTGGSELTTNTGTFVAYCFSEVAGYSKFGSYVANGESNGPFVYCGFRPKYILVKLAISATDISWLVFDTSRSPYNLADEKLEPNNADEEGSSNGIDILSNGFKIRTSNGGTNILSGDTYIFMAFAESPFKYANAR